MRLTFEVAGATKDELTAQVLKVCHAAAPDALWRWSMDGVPVSYADDGTVSLWRGQVTAAWDEEARDGG